MIIRGTTPTIRFTFKAVDVNNIESAFLTIKQDDVVVNKDIESATKGDGYIEWKLSQQETLAVKTGFFHIQCKYKLYDESVFASKSIIDEALEIENENVI